MRAYAERHRLLHRWPLIAVGLTLGCVLGLMAFAEPGLEARAGEVRAAEIRAVEAPAVAATSASASTNEVSACGGYGQRACCAVTEDSDGACQDGLVKQLGCTGDCAC